MGKRLYVAKRYEFDYGGPAEFNWKCYEFHRLLEALKVDYTDDTYSDEFDVDVSEWEEGLRKLENFDKLDAFEQEDIKYAADELEYTIEELIKVFKDYLDAYDKNNSYLHFCFI